MDIYRIVYIKIDICGVKIKSNKNYKFRIKLEI